MHLSSSPLAGRRFALDPFVHIIDNMDHFYAPMGRVKVGLPKDDQSLTHRPFDPTVAGIEREMKDTVIRAVPV